MDYNNISDRIKGRKKEVNADPFLNMGIFSAVVFGKKARCFHEKEMEAEKMTFAQRGRKAIFILLACQVMLLSLPQQGRRNHLSPKYNPF